MGLSIHKCDASTEIKQRVIDDINHFFEHRGVDPESANEAFIQLSYGTQPSTVNKRYALVWADAQQLTLDSLTDALGRETKEAVLCYDRLTE